MPNGGMAFHGGSAPSVDTLPASGVSPAGSPAHPFGLFPELGDAALPSSTDNLIRSGFRNDVDVPAFGTLTGILTGPQFRVVIRALEQRQGVDILTPPKVATLSGRQAQFKSVRVRYVVTDLDWSQIDSNATTGATSAVPAQPIAEPFELGPVVDLVPHVSADGYTIQMTVMSTVTEFLGYDLENGKRQETVTMSDGRKQIVTLPNQPCPIFRKRQMVANAIAWDGQTVVLAGGSDQLLANPINNQPLRPGTKLRDDAGTRALLIFITPTLIDATGNRIHKTEETTPGVPLQK